ncbi:3'-5' exonuclease domain-containing protein 2 [Candidatus Sumerlaeota bacterium]|nr:3'-5' exonuclease domain-containing protein 2 [Candidatus Sumerlaeota bacterium]
MTGDRKESADQPRGRGSHHRPALSNEEINRLPLRRYEGEVHLIRTNRQVTSALRALRAEEVLGFDTETKPSFRKGEWNPPALVQLAGGRGVHIFQISMLGFPEGLIEILANPEISKVGVAPTDDFRALKRLRPFEESGVIDLGPFATEHGHESNGLRGLAASVLGFRISKGARCSNWSRSTLSPTQITYAATDAWVSREIYLALCNGSAP